MTEISCEVNSLAVKVSFNECNSQEKIKTETEPFTSDSLFIVAKGSFRTVLPEVHQLCLQIPYL